MKTGFWLRAKDNNFNFMDNNKLADEFGLWNSPYRYLNGVCHAFAAALKYEYGYEIEVIVKENGGFIHAYAVHNGHYIDVRGANDNWDEFISEYDDTLPTHDREKLNIKSFEEYFTQFDYDDPDGYTEIIDEDAFVLIEDYPEYYKVA